MISKIKKTEDETSLPQRTREHRTDSEAVKIVRTKMSGDWLERLCDGQDYGIDMMYEVFDGDNPSGALVLFQVKGREAKFETEEISLSVPVKTLRYAQMFQTPFFLVHASVNDGKAYFVWLQKYIRVRLDYENPRWTKQQHITIHFPPDNELNNVGRRKIRSLANYVAHRDLGLEFLGHLIILEDQFETFRSGGGRAAIADIIAQVKKIRKIEVFFESYEENHLDIAIDFDEMLAILKKAEAYGKFDFGDDEKMEEYLLSFRMVARLFLSQDEADAIGSENMVTDQPY